MPIVCRYVCRVTYRKSEDQPGKVADPARDQLNREMQAVTAACYTARSFEHEAQSRNIAKC